MESYKSIFKKAKERKIYYFSCYRGLGYGYDYDKELCYTTEHINWITIHECVIEKPPLNVNDLIYINELEAEYQIAKKVRTTNGEIIYYVTEVDIIEDELTSKSIIKANEQKDKYYTEKQLKKEKEQNELTNKKKWYEFWK